MHHIYTFFQCFIICSFSYFSSEIDRRESFTGQMQHVPSHFCHLISEDSVTAYILGSKGH